MSAGWPWNQPGSAGGPPSSTFGAMPAAFDLGGPSLGTDVVNFHFTAFNPTILNCTVMGPRSLVYYTILTDPARPGATSLRDNQGASVAEVQWRTQPRINIRGSKAEMKVAEWLALSSDRCSRKMPVNNVVYRWRPVGADVYLTTADGARGLARIIKTSGLITLELTHDAMYLGLLESCIIATLVLQSGCNMD